MATDPAGLGYSYHLPKGGLFLRIRNSLASFSDLFSEFNKYIAPAPQHDRCERSVQMRLYSMHKREFVMVFLSFFAAFGLAIFIGLAGPPITEETDISAKEILAMTNGSRGANGLPLPQPSIASGPFMVKSQMLSTYNQQLWVFLRMWTSNNDEELYDKTFKVHIDIDGLTLEHKTVPVLRANNVRNRTRHVKCWKNTCDEFTVLHLGFLDYAHYIVTVRFFGLESFEKRYHITDLRFYFKTYSPAFTQIEIWFRCIYILTTFACLAWFAYNMRRFAINDWSLEQKWVLILLPLLILYNNPIFPLSFLMNSWFPGMMDGIFQATFLCALLMFWLCLYHGLRQTERKFLWFYLPKVICVGQIWLCAVILATWEKCNELRDPTYSHFLDTDNYNTFKSFFFASGGSYCLYLIFLIVKAYSELRNLRIFDSRLKFMTLLLLFVVSITIALTANRFGFGILEDNFVSKLSTTYKSSAQFMCFYGLLNFYVYTMAYVYSPPSGRPIHEPQLTKDNPAFSMINDSDEDVIYGSEDESRRPLNGGGGGGGLPTNSSLAGAAKRNDYDSD